MSQLSEPAILEIARLQTEADQLISVRNLSQSDRKKADLIIAKISSIRSLGLSSDEIRRDAQSKKDADTERIKERAFRAYLCGRPAKEIRDIEAGQQTITYVPTQNAPFGVNTGYLVPTSFANLVAEGQAQFDPLLNPNVVTLIQEKEFKLLPLQVPGWDLSTIAAQKVAETAQQFDGGPGNADPVFAGKLLNRWTYRTTLRASYEWEEDEAAYGRALNAMARAYGIGFARGIGKDLATGNGTTAPQGVLTGAALSGQINATAGKLVLTDLTNFYFALNKIYRSSPKCAWLMNDTVHKYLRNATDTSGRPLLSVERDFEILFGKRVYVCPSLPNPMASPALSNQLIFGDLSHYIVHASAPLIRRLPQRYADFYEAAYCGLLMVDAVVFDPTNGVTPPIISAEIQ